MIEIRPFELEDCQAVAQAHINYLNTSFKGHAGIELLAIYYQVIAQQDGGTGFVAVIDGAFAGFICGIWDRVLIRKSLRRKWDSLLFCALKLILQVPKMFPNLLSRVINPKAMYIRADGYELRPIVVLPECRGRGVADALILHLLEDAKQMGFTEITLLVEKRNLAAKKLYGRFGFRRERQANASVNALDLYRYSF